MADGIPIFGPYGDNGVAPTDLDECGGHTDSKHTFINYQFKKINIRNSWFLSLSFTKG